MPAEAGRALPILEVEKGTRLYRAVADRVGGSRLLLAGRLVRALTGEPWRGPAELAVRAGGPVAVRRLADGYFAVVGRPEIALPLLAVSGGTITVEAAGLGLRPASAVVALPPGSPLPAPPLTLALRPLPTTLRGRVVEAALGRAPIAGASLAFTDPSLLPLGTPLSRSHAAGALVQPVTLSPAGAAKSLDAAAVRGNERLRLSDRSGLAPGSLLRLGGALREEVVVVAEVSPEPPDLAQPGEVRLASPLARSFAVGSAAEPVSEAPDGPPALLLSETFAGGGVLEVGAPLGASLVRVEPAGSPEAEYRATGTLTDADGYYRLDGLDRPDAFELSAAAAGFTAQTRDVELDFDRPHQHADFRLEAI